MKKGISLAALLLLTSIGCGSRDVSGPGGSVSAIQSDSFASGRAPVNGIQMDYEIHGRSEGVPLVLLRGWSSPSS
jgi:hypothetical protein